MARTFVPEDLYRIRQVTDVAVHPVDGRAVFVVSWCDEETDSNRSQLWLIAPPGVGGAISSAEAGDPNAGPGEARQLTRGHADHSPRFSPDGRYLAYLSAPLRQPAQLHVLPLDGGEPWRLGPFDDGCEGPVWLPDSSALVVSAPTRPPEERGRSAEELAERPRPRRITTTRYRFNGRGWTVDRAQQLFLVPLDGGEPCPLTDGPWDASAPAVSPDGRWVLFESAREPDQEWLGGSDLWLVALPTERAADSTSLRPTGPAGAADSTSVRPTGTAGAAPLELRRLTDGQGEWTYGSFLPDGSAVLAVGHTARGDAYLALPWVIPLDGGPPRRLGDGETAVHPATGTSPNLAVTDDAVVLPGIERGRQRVDRYALDGSRVDTIAADPPLITAFAVDVTRQRLLLTGASPTRPAELFQTAVGRDVMPPDAGTPGAHRLTHLNDRLCEEVTFAGYEEVEARSADGYVVHGFVVRPPAVAATTGQHRGGDRRPGLLYVHGGPLAQYGLGFFDEFQAAAATGHVLVAGNPRGSEGYGSAHARAITGGGLGGRDWDDVQALADHLAALPDVDRDRLGIGGGSYGGFMAGWAIGHTDRFAAALSERAVNNWETMEGTSDIGAWFTRIYTGVTNRSDLDAQRRQSPITHVDRMTTPTLIIHSDEDWRCPPEQAEQLFVALRQRGVPCEMVRFPGENHELSRSGRPSLRVERLRIVHDWWSRWLRSSPFPPA
jgi:dipeptidyl aminopeptidase/acylaminoacyl peptidase